MSSSYSNDNVLERDSNYSQNYSSFLFYIGILPFHFWLKKTEHCVFTLLWEEHESVSAQIPLSLSKHSVVLTSHNLASIPTLEQRWELSQHYCSTHSTRCNNDSWDTKQIRTMLQSFDKDSSATLIIYSSLIPVLIWASAYYNTDPLTGYC